MWLDLKYLKCYNKNGLLNFWKCLTNQTTKKSNNNNNNNNVINCKIAPINTPTNILVAFGFHFFGFRHVETESKTNRYWLIDNPIDLIEEADKLYYEENYLEVYEMLNRMKYQDNVEIQWRICRVLFKMAHDKTIQKPIRDNMINEAYDLIIKTLELNPTNPEIHKWMAIILDMKSSFDGIIKHVQAGSKIKYHLTKSLELNPNDPTVLYMLGYWCYVISQLTWIQKQIAKVLFDYPPETTYEEAYEYFLKAEQLRPRFYVGNIYMLGLCSYKLKKFYLARYYSKIAADYPVTSDMESVHSENAKKLANKLKDYDITIESLCQ